MRRLLAACWAAFLCLPGAAAAGDPMPLCFSQSELAAAAARASDRAMQTMRVDEAAADRLIALANPSLDDGRQFTRDGTFFVWWFEGQPSAYAAWFGSDGCYHGWIVAPAKQLLRMVKGEAT